MTEEQKLIQDILDGEKKAFSTLMDRYKRLVSHIVFKMVESTDDRQDLSQDVFLKVYQNLRDFNQQCKLSSWIGRIAFNTCLNHLGKKQPVLWDDLSPELSLDTLPAGGSLLDEAIAMGDVASKIQEEIGKLPAPYNVIAAMFHLDEMSYQEIGEITGMPDGTVKSYLFRARRELRKRLEGKYQIEDWRP